MLRNFRTGSPSKRSLPDRRSAKGLPRWTTAIWVAQGVKRSSPCLALESDRMPPARGSKGNRGHALSGEEIVRQSSQGRA